MIAGISLIDQVIKFRLIHFVLLSKSKKKILLVSICNKYFKFKDTMSRYILYY